MTIVNRPQQCCQAGSYPFQNSHPSQDRSQRTVRKVPAGRRLTNLLCTPREAGFFLHGKALHALEIVMSDGPWIGGLQITASAIGFPAFAIILTDFGLHFGVLRNPCCTTSLAGSWLHMPLTWFSCRWPPKGSGVRAAGWTIGQPGNLGEPFIRLMARGAKLGIM